MNEQSSLFDIEPRFCIDTNVVVSFLSDSDDEYYGGGVFTGHWNRIETLVNDGLIIAPRQVERELSKHATKREQIGPWLRIHSHMFQDVDTDDQLILAKRIVNKYPAYARNDNYLGDLEVMTLAGALGLTVISLEAPNQQSGARRPKIPNVCKEFQIACVSVVGLLRQFT